MLTNAGASGRWWWTLACVALAGSALVVGVLAPAVAPAQRTWAVIAGIGYLCAALVAAATRRPAVRVITAVALTGAVLVPMLMLIGSGHAQPEVGVVENPPICCWSPAAPTPRTPVAGSTTTNTPRQVSNDARIGSSLHGVASCFTRTAESDRAGQRRRPLPPGVALFGLPRALLGSGVLSDPRWGFAVVFIAAMVAVVRPGHGTRGPTTQPRSRNLQ